MTDAIPTETSIRILEVPVNELGSVPDAMREMYEESLSGILVRGALPPRIAERGVEALSGPASPLPRITDVPFAGWCHGPGLVNAGEDLDGYLRRSRGLREGLSEAFGRDLVAHHEDLFRRVASGRSVGVPSRDGASYAPMTVRVLEDGGLLPMHCGNETHTWPPMAHLCTLIDRRDQLSFFTPLALPDAGGELVIYDVRHRWPDELAEGEEVFEMSGTEVPPEVGTRGSLVVDLRVGDMLLFDGGRLFHRVTPVRGPRARWTVGGFMAPSIDGSHVYFWS